MAYGFAGAASELYKAEPSIEDLAKRLIWCEFGKAGISVYQHEFGPCTEALDKASSLIARLIRQEVERCQANISPVEASHRAEEGALHTETELAAERIPRLDEELCDPMDKLTWQIVYALEATVTPAQWLQARELLSRFEPSR